MNLKTIVVVPAVAVLGPLSSLAQTSASPRTLTGVITDAMCGQTHMMKGKSDAECTRACVKEGSRYALIVGKNLYSLEGHEADLDKYAGQKVVLTGAVNGQSVKVQSVASAK